MSGRPGSEREREGEGGGEGTDEAEFVRDGGVAREVYAESSGFFTLGEEDVALAEKDVPELVQLVERFQAQFRCGPAPACVTTPASVRGSQSGADGG